MGGGSSSGKNSLGDDKDLKELEDKARKELNKDYKHNTFISFDFEDFDEVNMLRAQAKNENSDIEFNDYSVKDSIDSDRTEYIKQKISERIRQCSITIVYLSDNSFSSKWVKWEVEKSIQLEKNVIAVYKSDTAPSQIPAYIKDNKIKIIPWKKLADYLK